MKYWSTFFFITLWWMLPQPLSAQIADYDVELDPNEKEVTVHFRGTSSATVENVQATIDGDDKKVEYSAYKEQEDAETLILFLLENSSFQPRRFDQVKEAVRKIVEEAKPGRHNLGLYTYNQELNAYAEPGFSHAKLVTMLPDLPRNGVESHMFQSLVGSVKKIQKTEADRRAIIHLSNGNTTDEAYHIEDAVDAINKSDTILFNVGLADSQYDLSPLQNLQKLAENSDGQYYNIQHHSYYVDPVIASQAYGFIESGGRATLDLNGVSGKAELQLKVDFSNQTTDTITHQLSMPKTKAASSSNNTQKEEEEKEEEEENKSENEKEKPDAGSEKEDSEKGDKEQKEEPDSTAPSDEPKEKKNQNEEKTGLDKNTIALIVVAAVVLLALIILFVIITRKNSKKQANQPTPITPGPDSDSKTQVEPPESEDDGPTRRHTPSAGAVSGNHPYIELFDGQKTTYSLARGPMRIGRNKDNDIVFQNDSVSTNHAEIIVRHGSYVITDLESTNGVLVNEKRVEKQTLNSGDIIEIGEIKMRFVKPNK